MTRSRQNELIVGAVGGMAGGLTMLGLMAMGKTLLGAASILDLIAQYISELNFFDQSAGPAARGFMLLGLLVFLIDCAICGVVYFILSKGRRVMWQILLGLSFSILLWGLFITIVLHWWGYGLFGKYLTGFPPLTLGVLLISFIAYGAVLVIFRASLPYKSQ